MQTSLAQASVAEQLRERSPNIAILHNGFVELAVRPDYLSPRINTIRAGMEAITNNPDRLEQFPWQVLTEDDYGPKYAQEVGLKITDPADTESKWTFHYSNGIDKRLKPRLLIEHAAFFEALDDLDQWSLVMALSVAKAFDRANARERAYAGSLGERLMRGTRVIRVLRYRHKGDGHADAKMHVDRSFFTVHPWSSHKGLCMRSPDGTLHRVNETSPESALIFPGEKFAAVTRGRWGLGTPHGVRDQRRELGTRSDSEDRFAIVCFVHPAPDAADAAWLLANREAIEAMEATLAL